MRVPFNFKYRNYPNSKELTQKSIRIGTITHPVYGLILGVLPGLAAAVLIPSSVTVPMVLMLAGIVAGPLLLRAYRKKKFAEYDAQYKKLMKSQEK